MVYLALTYDHRIVDGADAARFLTTIKDRLEAGEFERRARASTSDPARDGSGRGSPLSQAGSRP